MDYKDEIIRLLNAIDNEVVLKKIYTFVKSWTQKREDTSNEEMPPPLKKE